MVTPRLRFAPSPTGFLHVGGARTMLFNWLVARRQQGQVLLRIEDHDRDRSRVAYEHALLDDLDWLGFHADESGRDSGGLCRQSERGGLYERALAQLDERHLVYACACSRRPTGAPAVKGRYVRILLPGRDKVLGLVQEKKGAPLRGLR